MSAPRTFNRVLYSFPIQLVVLHFKKTQLMMMYWLLLFGFTTELLSTRFGIPFLFLNPEYLGRVGWRSYLLMGVSMGAFIMAFNISSFLLNSFRFPFLATLSRTFIKYTTNNFIIPASFLLVYCCKVYTFQQQEQLMPVNETLFNLAVYLSGVFVVIVLTLRYFMVTNKDIFRLFGITQADLEEGKKKMKPLSAMQRRLSWRVDTYVVFPFRVKLVRDVRHYKRYMIQQVFRQNHINAAVVEIVVFATFIMLGLFRDSPYFRIPAGASITLLFTMLLMLSGVFRYWLKAWASTALVFVFLFINFLSHFETFNPRNKAYGVDYTKKPAEYSREKLMQQVNDSIVTADILHTTAILDRWKQRWEQRGIAKPKMLLLNVSGGGLRSCVFTFRTLQAIDSAYSGDLLRHTAFATGSSGGLISMSYYRELFLSRRDSLLAANLSMDNAYLNNMGKDMLNSVAFSTTVADIFLNNQHFSEAGNYYIKDRAWAWEEQLLENTGHVLDKRLRDYEKPEMEAEIPILVITPTIINDGRALQISAQPVSYLLHESGEDDKSIPTVANGVEFSRYFRDYSPGNLRLTSALRMNSAFPYVMPAVSLPSEPAIEVMDAGIRDNYGIINSVQFLHTFREWIRANTSGVVVLQIRDTYKQSEVEDNSIKTLYEKVMAPMRNVSGNFIIMQDYNFDHYLRFVRDDLGVPMDVVIFQMPDSEDKISLSWHLTQKEKRFVKEAALSEENRSSLEHLLKILPPVIKKPQVPAVPSQIVP